MTRSVALMLVLAAAACTAPPPPEGPVGPPPGADMCGASRMQWLVGRPRSEIPPQPAGATWRVACTTCPVTMDYNERRLNIFYDEASGVVREVKCG